MQHLAAMKQIGIVTTFLATAVITILWSGWVLVKLWHWFVVPTLGFHDLRIPYAIGLSLIVKYLTMEPNIKKPDEKQSATQLLFEGVGVALMKPAVALLVGWIVQLFL